MAAANARRLAAVLLVAAFANGALSFAQQRASGEFEPLPEETTGLLREMTRSAEVIFAGEVISVQRPAGDAEAGQAADSGSGSGGDFARNAGEGVVVIQFRVDAAVRGCTTGSVYMLREWAGLWAGRDRYRVGDRLLLFLHGKNASGLDSPVGGRAGVIPLRGGATAPGPYDATATATDWLVDLRWVEAQAGRGVSPDAGGGAGSGMVRETGPLRRTTAGAGREPAAERRPGAEGEAIFATGVPPLEPVAGPEPVWGSGKPHWRALPQGSGGSMQPLARVLSLCGVWARSLQ